MSFAMEPFELFCARFGIEAPFTLKPVRAGRNSEVLLIGKGMEHWIVKHYFQHSTDKRDRLGTEFGFLTFLNNSGVAGVSHPLGMDQSLHYALYSCLPGKRPEIVTARHIAEAAEFIGNINRFRNSSEAQSLPLAADACFTLQDHINLAETRINRLMVTLRLEGGVEAEASRFLKEKLHPMLELLKARVSEQLSPYQLAEPLSPEERILSPSDFGFHNTLEENNSLFFLDFEYAGWDDPAKLICDFICQPELPVSAIQARQFTEELSISLPFSGSFSARVELLLPFHRMKWCGILLNEFREEEWNRRIHAGVESAGMLNLQLGKSKQYYNEHLAILT